MRTQRDSGLRIARFLMVVGSLSPLFILWAIRGAHGIPDKWWIGFCIAFVAVPNLVLYARWRLAHVRNDHRVIIVQTAKDQSEHLLVYLFAMLIPLFGVDLGGTRDTIAVLVAFGFILFIFFHMNLHYINILFALFGYNVFTVEINTSTAPGAQTTSKSVVILSKRTSIAPSTQIDGIRLSDTVLVEKE